MKFKLNSYSAVVVYAPIPTDFYATQNDWYNAGDIIKVDFDEVVESVFIRDYLAGNFTPVDTKAEQWVESVKEQEV
jgi:hypothetical protein